MWFCAYHVQFDSVYQTSNQVPLPVLMSDACLADNLVNCLFEQNWLHSILKDYAIIYLFILFIYLFIDLFI